MTGPKTLVSTTANQTYHWKAIQGVNVFYREAGNADAPTLLLHGYPSSSRMYDPLIPLLATKYHIIAPDYPGFGLSDSPGINEYSYSFDNIASTMSGLMG